MSNLDKIKAFDLDEMASFIDSSSQIDICDSSVYVKDADGAIRDCKAETCISCIKKWLLREAEEMPRNLFEREMPELIQEELEV